MADTKKIPLWPFLITLGIILLDQITKYLVVKHIGSYEKIEILGEFFRLIHVRNKAVAFSLGRGAPEWLRIPLFLILPTLLLGALSVAYFRMKNLTMEYRLIMAGILGGGVGNLIDRYFRPDGVVDFLDFKFYGIFGMERWPTFNVADMAVVISGIFLFILMVIAEVKERRHNSIKGAESENSK